ncbi:MAG: Fe-S cluster assembly protein SufD [Gammaproteobacteria bacterium]|nr:Fe-S cluster assembly protein SufD [Gammaproteobacteria bacterium]
MNHSLLDASAEAERYIGGLDSRAGDWLAERRRSAVLGIQQLGLPDRRQERWRYSGIDGLLDGNFSADWESTDNPLPPLESVMPDGTQAGLLVFVDGSFQAELSFVNDTGIQFTSLRAAMAKGDRKVLAALGSLSGTGRHAFSAINLATMQDGAVISVSPGKSIDQPIELLHIATAAAGGRMLRPRHLITLDKGSQASIVERHLCLDADGYFNNVVSEILLQEDARLDHQRVQLEGSQAYHLSEVHVQLGARANYRAINAAVGARWSRTEINGGFLAAGANLDLEGLYLAGDGQLVDFHLDVVHGVSGCSSRSNFKGIVYGQGRAVFDGRILVERQAQQSDAHLTNANLMLSRGSEVDTKPQLEILADDVKCSHGTTVGQLDPQAVFYLRSRGLSPSQARRLLCLGFASEILEGFGNVSLRGQLADHIQRRVESIDLENV